MNRDPFVFCKFTNEEDRNRKKKYKITYPLLFAQVFSNANKYFSFRFFHISSSCFNTAFIHARRKRSFCITPYHRKLKFLPSRRLFSGRVVESGSMQTSDRVPATRPIRSLVFEA